ncbi:putative quinol monooxygenase [Fundicoccus sp. Sow4_H7]|uniref:putative quinol monooxygenase n=1 Tax=Fundicoccus sp. Sow4_H7 TaxID=3438784 RepID=UPI003F904D40
MQRYAVNRSTTATPGKGEELQRYLLEDAEGMLAVDNCYCYIVGVNEDEPDKVFAYEVWEDAAAHQASLQMDVFRQLINKAKPIIAGMEDYPDLTIIGGKATF